ncbi:hypothetical protein EJB05_07863, partial [Eragrostis curvula]
MAMSSISPYGSTSHRLCPPSASNATKSPTPTLPRTPTSKTGRKGSAPRAVSSSSAPASPATYGGDEYFMYKAAGDGKPASLDPVPLPNDHRIPTLGEFGIVPRGHGGHYLVAALCLGMDPMNYLLHIYSSEDRRWRSIRLPNPCPELNKVITSKVVTLGDGELGWVDFQHGMLVCSNLHDESPGARYVPLPDPLPENRGRLQKLHPGPSTRRFRDLTCVNGVIELVEMEHRIVVITEDTSDSGRKELLCDSELIMSRKRKRADDGKPKQLLRRDGWKLVTWSRTVSCDRWRKGCVVDVDDISIDESTLSLLLPGRSGTTFQSAAFREVYLAFPAMSSCGDDVVYLKSTEKSSGSKGCVVAIDREIILIIMFPFTLLKRLVLHTIQAKMRSLAAILFVLAVVAGAASAGFVDPPEDTPAGTGAPQLGRFAVLVYNLNRGTKLRYVGVSDSERHPDKGGVRYHMTVTAADPAGASAQYGVVAWGIPKSYQWMLLEFNKLTSSQKRFNKRTN